MDPARLSGGRSRRVPGAGLLAAATLVLALLSPAAQAGVPAEFFGVVLQNRATSDEYDVMGAGGVGSVRVVVPWAYVQPQANGPFHWAHTDQVVGDAAAAGIQTVPVLLSSPSWAVHCKSDGRSCLRTPPVGSPAQLARWTRFVNAAVDRYGPSGEFWAENPDVPYTPVSSWQIWNEPNLPVYWKPRPSPKEYAKLLSASASAIRSRDPGAEIVLAGLTGDGGGPKAVTGWSYLSKLYKQHTKRLFDAVAIHPYDSSAAGTIDEVKRMASTIGRHHDSAKLWVTEIGWSSDAAGSTVSTGLRGQARRLKEAFSSFVAKRQAWDLERVFWFSWRDTPNGEDEVCSWCGHSGLFTGALIPKPSWLVFQHYSLGLPIPAHLLD
jgi:hypothetical protein